MTVWSLIKKSYKEIYRNLFSILLSSMLWFLTAGLVIMFGYISIQVKFYLPIIIGLVIVGPMTAQSFYVSNKIVNYKQVSLKDFWIGIKKYFLKSLFITLILVLIVFILTIDFKFLMDYQYKVGIILTPLYIYLLIFLGMMSIYCFPLMIELGEENENDSIRSILKYSFSLTINNLLYTLFIFLNIIIFGTLNIALVFGLLILFMGGIALIANNATLNLLVKYGIKKQVNGPYDFKNNQ
ncbi:putative membrane protein YesL [Orenia metallireducens]|uniref:Uncharacterized membrane protein YesL n=2 Tax=Orenia metallireducens TaxID=1413210 RepID=A0A285H7M8_9FIRM|nr:DUF624 domain-containing protein [Orenia metallireducens]PRX28624.1 putative membrane protein YesL [Orenia metallireducens]SNY30866.1 Uncharacterized membrane protein YesL [Orenia metallireducens]